ncbi:MAG: hypothetical protein AB1349_07645 [Elusimicrobiota bacterium]
MKRKQKKEIKKWLKVVTSLKKKYNINFIQFEKKLGKDFNLTWEHEKDYIDWDWALTNIKNK